MTFIEIYNRVITHRGDTIDFSDGVISNAEEKFFQSDSLTTQWNRIEETVGKDDTYNELMVWTMYQVFHKHARELYGKNYFTLNPKDINKTEIEEQYYNNLQEEGWEEELAEYERE